MEWIQIKWKPKEVGTYLVATSKGKIRIDRWDGESWGLCRPRTELKRRNQGRYKPHIAWMPLPNPPRKEDLE